MITGTMTQKKTGFALTLATASFDMSFDVVENPYKTKENHPDYHVEVRTPRGRMMRVGAMWKAVSERTDAEYYSISVTDRAGKIWRANAVRNNDMKKGEWSIVPLAGGQTERIMLTGDLELLDDGNLAGVIESYDFAMNFVAVAVAEKSDDNHPDFHVEVASPAGTAIRMGSVWASESQQGNRYYSIAFWSPHGTQHRANAVRREDSPEGKFEIIPLSELREAAAA